jgi:cell division protein FtsB
MTDDLMMLAYLAPLMAILGLFWQVARKLGKIESELEQMRRENHQLKSRIDALRDLLSVLVDSRRNVG